jgi:pseudouridine 5'-phosphatase
MQGTYWNLFAWVLLFKSKGCKKYMTTIHNTMAEDSSNAIDDNQVKPPIQAIVFDLDGTLIDTEGLSDKAMLMALESILPKSIRQSCAQNGDLLPWALKQQILGKRGAEWAPLVLDYVEQVWHVPRDTSQPIWTVEDLWSGWEQSLHTLCPQVQACPGSVELVQALARLQYPMAIATSSRALAVAQKRQRHEATLFQYIPIIVAGDHPAVQHGKPAPDIYLQAAKELGVDPSACLVFEDALSGVQSARAAGCRVVAIPDARFSDAEKQVFVDAADVVLPDLWHFDGTPFGINLQLMDNKRGI